MSDMNVGRIYSTTINQPSGITEVLLEKVERERNNLQDQRDFAMGEIERLRKERDHYKASLEEISTSIDDWLNSLIQEPSLDFIHAIKAYAQKKLKEVV